MEEEITTTLCHDNEDLDFLIGLYENDIEMGEMMEYSRSEEAAPRQQGKQVSIRYLAY